MASMGLAHAAPPEHAINAAKIDRLIEKRILAEGMTVPERADDHVFLRRAFLSALGRIPTVAELEQFRDLSSPSSRMEVVDYVYNHEGYNSHMINWSMDLLRLKDRNDKKMNAQALIHWVREAVQSNMPWNEFAKALVSTKGNAWVDSGAAGYYAMDIGMQNDNLANTSFAFLGVKLECAQCHDDPFQEWERMDFYELSALVNGPTTMSRNIGENMRKLAAEDPENYNVNGLGRVDLLHRSLSYFSRFGTPDNKGQGTVKLPKDWQYEDGVPGEQVAARTPFGEKHKFSKALAEIPVPDFSSVRALPKSERPAARQKIVKAHQQLIKDRDASRPSGLDTFGAWLTSDNTPQFAYTISARMWERVIGFSLTETLGVYEEPEDSNFPVLWEYLAELMKEYDYDLKLFQQTLASTNFFQSQATTRDVVNGEVNSLSGRVIRRMKAEQIWDSLLTLMVTEPEALPQRQLQQRYIYRGYDLGPIDEVVTHVLSMDRKTYTQYVKNLYRDMAEGRIKKAGASNQPQQMAMMMSPKPNKKKASKALRRASELPSPIPAGHFLATFGQSERRVIDGYSQEGSVSQALSLYNGSVQKHLIDNRQSSINQSLRRLNSTSERIEYIFLSILSREPSSAELKTCKQEISASGQKGYQNIISALLSSQEFLFII